jgi:hypothetical protein
MSTQTWTIDEATSPMYPTRVFVSGPAITAETSYQMFRIVDGTTYEPIPGTFVAAAGTPPTLVVDDWWYPLDTSYVYQLMDATGTVIIDQSSNADAVPSGGMPWIRDVIYPANRVSPLRIVDVTGRMRAGRVSPYYQMQQKYPVTIGDIRSASAGTLTAFCYSHVERDDVIQALSSGSPVQLRVPPPCRVVVDEMYFTPIDIEETRFGRSGACVLTIDFIETQVTQLPPFQAVSYGVQTTNADAASMDYEDLRGVFMLHTYQDMSESQTGIAP